MDINEKTELEFYASRLVSCYWNYYMDLVSPLPTTEKLQEIFDIGSEKHFDDQVLLKGAHCIIDIEESRKIKHKELGYSLVGRRDFLRFDMQGKYIEDLKTSQFKSFFYRLKEYPKINENYKLQLSIYAYLEYINTGVRITKGVITAIDKENPRNRISLESVLYIANDIEKFIDSHPVILKMLDKINEEKLYEVCVAFMQGKSWMCGNCQYSEKCKIRLAI